MDEQPKRLERQSMDWKPLRGSIVGLLAGAVLSWFLSPSINPPDAIASLPNVGLGGLVGLTFGALVDLLTQPVRRGRIDGYG